MKRLLITSIYSMSTLFCLAQLKPLDLSSKTEINQPITPQTITSITIVNALAKPQTSYKIEIEIQHININGPLSIPTGINPAAALGGVGGSCTTLDNATDKLVKEPNESNIPAEILDIQKEVKNADATTCANSITDGQNAIAATTKTYTILPIVINKNDILKITISRDKSTWVFTFKNEQPNHWTTYYGFTYIPDVITKFPNYYANQQTDGSYIISKMNGSNKNVLQNVSPTAMFTYRFFDKKPDAVLKFGLTGGIFYNTEILGAMLGPSLVIADNVTLNTGISFVQKYQLKGQYKEGETIQDNLDFDQLHNKIWTYDMFISIGFNIPELFKGKSNSTSTTPSTTP